MVRRWLADGPRRSPPPAHLRVLFNPGPFPIAAVATPLSFVLWRTPAGASAPPSNVIPLMLPIEVVIPAVTFGLGAAFLLVGRPLVSTRGVPRLSRGAYFSIKEY